MIPASPSQVKLTVRDLGRMRYAEALAIQRLAQQQVIAQRDEPGGAMQLLLVEHDPPVITVSRRPGARNHLIATESQLQVAGVELAQTDRGGDITYHGPGQLVVDPILDLNQLNLRLNSYLRFLEQIIIDVLGNFGILGQRDAAATGVWVQPPSLPAAKIAAIGVRVSRWVSMHGLALNVAANLDHFNLIVPCGLAGRSVTSMERLLGDRCPDMNRVKAVMIDAFTTAVNQAVAADSSPDSTSPSHSGDSSSA
jgi:lipoyl(octanoyl) transferase